MMKILLIESWKDCHKSYSNPFEGGLQCVFEEVETIIIIIIVVVTIVMIVQSLRYTGHCLHFTIYLFFINVFTFFLLFSLRVTLAIASTVSVELSRSLDSWSTVPSPLLKNDLLLKKYNLSKEIQLTKIAYLSFDKKYHWQYLSFVILHQFDICPIRSLQE